MTQAVGLADASFDKTIFNYGQQHDLLLNVEYHSGANIDIASFVYNDCGN